MQKAGSRGDYRWWWWWQWLALARVCRGGSRAQRLLSCRQYRRRRSSSSGLVWLAATSLNTARSSRSKRIEWQRARCPNGRIGRGAEKTREREQVEVIVCCVSGGRRAPPPRQSARARARLHHQPYASAAMRTTIGPGPNAGPNARPPLGPDAALVRMTLASSSWLKLGCCFVFLVLCCCVSCVEFR